MKHFFENINNIQALLKGGFVNDDQVTDLVLQAFYTEFGNERLIWALTYFQKLERDNQKKEISKYRTSLQFSAGLFNTNRPTTPEILFYLKGAFPEGTCEGYSQVEINVFHDLVSKLNLSQIYPEWAERHEMNEYIQLLKLNNYVD